MEALSAVRRRGSHIYLGNRPTDGAEVVGITRRKTLTPRKIPDYNF
jgi:hypothetical protein